jgi:hypothetical protein
LQDDGFIDAPPMFSQANQGAELQKQQSYLDKLYSTALLGMSWVHKAPKSQFAVDQNGALAIGGRSRSRVLNQKAVEVYFAVEQ